MIRTLTLALLTAPLLAGCEVFDSTNPSSEPGYHNAATAHTIKTTQHGSDATVSDNQANSNNTNNVSHVSSEPDAAEVATKPTQKTNAVPLSAPSVGE